MRSLMIVTCRGVDVSCGLKVRPARRGICMVAKYPSPITLCLTLTCSSSFTTVTRMPVFQLPWLNRKEAKLAAFTPGIELTRCSICWNIAIMRGSLAFSPVTAESIWRRSTPSRLKPVSTLLRFTRLRTNRICADQQHKRDGNLTDDECLAQRTSCGTARVAAAILQRIGQFDA